MTNVAKEQLSMLSDALTNAIQSNFGGASTLILRSPMYQGYYNMIFDTLEMFIDDNGMVDGVAVHKILSEKYPVLTKWISVPQEKFLISDEINGISQMMIGREVM